MNNVEYLLEYCKGKEELYNQVANTLWAEFGIRSAEISLLCTYVADTIIKERDKI